MWLILLRTNNYLKILKTCTAVIAQTLIFILPTIKTWCERWNIKINEHKTRGIYFSRSRRPPESHLTLNGRDIPFVSSAKYLGVIFDKKITWRLHIEMIEAKAFRTFIIIYSLFKSERLSANIKLTPPHTKLSIDP
jgi:hypothetical protein